MCPYTHITVVPLHVATAKDHGNFVCHGDKPALFLLRLTMHTSSFIWYPLITDSTVNGHVLLPALIIEISISGRRVN